MKNTMTVENIADQQRPMTFSEVVGQPYVTGVGKRIGQGVISGQGYILAGPKGCGKTTTARIIAKAVNCQHLDSDTGDPCNSCPDCMMINAGNHPQVTEVNAASSRGINDIKEVLSTMNLVTPKGMRVYILDELHMLTREAFSVLLKPMEQPPAHVLFVGTTTAIESIPETILSRCPIIPISGLSNDDISDILHRLIAEKGKESEQWAQLGEDDVRASVAVSHGSARAAITHLASIVFHGVSASSALHHADTIAQAFLRGDTAKVVTEVKELLQNKSTPSDVIVASLFDALGSAIDDDKDSAQRYAQSLASLALIASKITQSTPAIVVAAHIASCTPDTSDVVVKDNKVAIKDNTKKQPRPHKVAVKDNQRNRDADDKVVVKDNTTTAPNRPGNATDIPNKIFAEIINKGKRAKIGSEYLDALDDPERSEGWFEGDKAVFVLDSERSEDVEHLLESVFDDVVVFFTA